MASFTSSLCSHEQGMCFNGAILIGICLLMMRSHVLFRLCSLSAVQLGPQTDDKSAWSSSRHRASALTRRVYVNHMTCLGDGGGGSDEVMASGVVGLDSHVSCQILPVRDEVINERWAQSGIGRLMSCLNSRSRSCWRYIDVTPGLTGRMTLRLTSPSSKIGWSLDMT